MSIRTKTILIIIATLLIGMILGILVSGPLMRHHFERPPKFAQSERSKHFVTLFERLIQPQDNQREAVVEILDRYSKRIEGLDSRHRLEMQALFDSMQTELSPILTEEQKVELTKRLKWPPGPPPHPPGER
jgi:hypothetical protein